MSDQVGVGNGNTKLQQTQSKSDLIRQYIAEMRSQGRLDLSKSISNEEMREIAEAVSSRHGVNVSLANVKMTISRLRQKEGITVEHEEPKAESDYSFTYEYSTNSSKSYSSNTEYNPKHTKWLWVILVPIFILGIFVIVYGSIKDVLKLRKTEDTQPKPQTWTPQDPWQSAISS